jgi:hypothetical protein
MVVCAPVAVHRISELLLQHTVDVAFITTTAVTLISTASGRTRSIGIGIVEY